MQVGGAFGVALLGATLQRREFFHYAQYGELLNNAFSAPAYKAQMVMQEILLRGGFDPAEVAAKGKTLLALWVHRQATAGGFADAFVFSALWITIGILPALLIRNRHAAKKAGPPVMAE